MNSIRQYDASTSVEPVELARSGRKFIYPPTEKIGVIEVENFPSLGKLAALRFIEWVQRILDRWDSGEIKRLLKEYGIDAPRRPDMRSLVFVQIDEFYPMN